MGMARKEIWALIMLKEAISVQFNDILHDVNSINNKILARILDIPHDKRPQILSFFLHTTLGMAFMTWNSSATSQTAYLLNKQPTRFAQMIERFDSWI